MVMSRKLDRDYPELAASVFQAFEESKRTAYSDILSDQRGFGIVYLRERMKEQVERWGDPWVNGITPNKRMIDTFLQYNHEQGMIDSRMSYEDIFAAGTLDT